MVVTIEQNLQKIGFTEYEARTYVALLKSNPSTAYETAKNAAIPSSKIYQVIARLVEKGIVLELKEQGKRRYVPMDPNEFLQFYRQGLESTMAEIDKGFKSLSMERNVSYIWNLDSREGLIEKAQRLCDSARETILLSTWQEEVEFVLPQLRSAESRRVKLSIVYFGVPGKLPGRVFPHPIAETLFHEKGGRGFVMVSDSREALMGTVFDGGSIEGAWSRNAGFVTLAEDYIKHDIYIMKIVKRFDPLLIKTFGERYKHLRDIFSDMGEYTE